MILKLLFTSLIIFSFTACSSTNQKLGSKCYEVPQTGKCRAMFTKYYFNQENKKCEKFVWGGCGGNIPFETLKECKSSCEK